MIFLPLHETDEHTCHFVDLETGVAEKPGFSHAFNFAFSAARPLIQLAGSQCPGHSSCWVVPADSPQNEEVE